MGCPTGSKRFRCAAVKSPLAFSQRKAKSGSPAAKVRSASRLIHRCWRNQLQANGIQRRAQYLGAKLKRLGSTGKNSDEGPRLPRRREQFEAGAGDDSQRALAADQQLHHVVSGDVLYPPAAALGFASIASYKAHADTVIAQAAVAMAQRPIQSGSQQSTDGAALRLRSEEHTS